LIDLLPQLAPWFLAVVFTAAVALNPWSASLGLVLWSWLPGAATTPGELSALSTGWSWTGAALLLATGFLLRRMDGPWLLWEAVHAPVRLILPPLILLLALHGTGQEATGPLLLSVTLALVLLAARWGFVVHEELEGRYPRIRSLRGMAIEAVGAAALAAAAIGAPSLLGILTSLALITVLFQLRTGLRLSRGVPVFLATLGRAVEGAPAWRAGASLPGWVKGGEDPDPSNGDGRPSPARGTPALLQGEGAGQEPRLGWLVFRGGRPVFVFRSPTRVWEVDLGGVRARVAETQPGPLLHRIELDDGAERLVLGTPHGGPGPGELVREFGAPSDRSHL
jgi:hypothetical protein